jgi:glyceraldehyde 3-phosphate dehydrogenase
MKIAINGMGRIGRLLCKLLQTTSHQIVAVNDLMPKENLAYLLEYDSTYGQYFLGKNKYGITDEGIQINKQKIKVFSEPTPVKLPWKELEVDVVVDCSGRFLTRELLSHHLEAGAKRVLLSTTGGEGVPMVIRGFNDSPELLQQPILASGGCMTNCTVLLLHHLIKNFGVESVHINVTHSYTSRQSLVDSPNADFRRGRAATTSIIPVKIDLHDTLEKVFPTLHRKVISSSTRVPIICGALCDLNFIATQSVDVRTIHELFAHLSKNELKGLVDYNEKPVTSSDILCNPNSAIVDATLTHAISKHVKLSAWFDDQFAFTNRLIEIIASNKIII